MSRTLNRQELIALDTMIARTGVAAVVSAIATYCSIKANQCVAYSTGQDQWETRANELNNATDRMNANDAL